MRTRIATTPWGDTLEIPAEDRSGLGRSRETTHLAALLRPGMTVVDVGAGIGFCTALFAHRTGPSGQVVAAEPHPENFELLQRNVTRNGYPNAQVVHAAVTTDSRARLTRSTTHHGRHSLHPGNVLNPQAGSLPVPAVTLDRLVCAAAAGDRAVDLLKVDVEGAELDVLRSGPAMLRTARRVWLEFWPDGLRAAGEDPVEVPVLLLRLGFEVVLCDLVTGATLPVADGTEPLRHVDRMRPTLGPDGQGNPLPLVYLLATR